jgi:hypothetical protein
MNKKYRGEAASKDIPYRSLSLIREICYLKIAALPPEKLVRHASKSLHIRIGKRAGCVDK